MTTSRIHPMEMRLLPLGDAAFTIEFPALSGAAGARHVRAVRMAVETIAEQDEIRGIVDMISATRSLTICIDPTVADLKAIQEKISEVAEIEQSDETAPGRLWHLPVCYEGDYAPDMEDIARMSALGVDDVIRLHSGTIYDVLLIGFLPGFPFMGEIADAIRFPRRTTPRTAVPAGSVAIANNQTAIYPWISPGGWHLLGRCAVPLFNSSWNIPALLSPGDQVRFQPVGAGEFEDIAQDIASENRSPQSFAAPSDGDAPA